MMFIIFIMVLLALLAPNQASDSSLYTINFNDGILKSIIPQKDKKIEDLDLSSMGIRQIEPQAFDQLTELNTLILSNNSLVTLPEFLFANLTQLKQLSLSSNKLHSLENSLVGLHNLEILNLSYTDIRHLRRGHLFSLPSTVNIITEGNIFETLSNVAFDNPFLKNTIDFSLPDDKHFATPEADYWKMSSHCEYDLISKLMKSHPLRETEKHLERNIRVKLCSEDGIVSSLEEIEKDEIISDKCVEVPIDYEKRRIVAKNLAIEDFDRDWYRLQKLRMLELDLSQNDITELSKELLNDLPGDLISVNLMSNKIKTIRSHVIENGHLKTLILSDNVISKIEEGAFENTKLTGLYLSGNKIRCLKFCKSLPTTLTEISLGANSVERIAEDVFSGLPNLFYLNLRENKIDRLNKNVFRGLRSLTILDITKNNMKSVEPGSFRNLYSLNVLNLYKNSISYLERGTFEGLASLKTLNLAWNKIENVTKFSFADLPLTLDYLYLDFNEIYELESASFMTVPRITLSLDSNRIQRISKGVFDTPFLQNLHLHNNSLKVIEADAFIRTPYLKKLWLGSNSIQKIEKGMTRNLGYLSILDISKNPIKVLENGIFYGLPKVRGHFVYFGENEIEVIEGGLFEDFTTSAPSSNYLYLKSS